MNDRGNGQPVLAPELPPLRIDEGRVLRIGATRVTLDSVLAAFHRGETPEQIAQDYDSVSLGQIYAAIGYYLEHRSEVDRYLAAGLEQRTFVRSELKSRNDPAGIRARLLSRRAPRS